MDTIFALSSARGKAGVGVIRVSGPSAHTAARRLAGPLPEARRASLRKLTLEDGSHLDDALVIVFDRGKSYTGEDTAEFHVHGGVATISAALNQLGAYPGIRMAEPGEFTLQALLNGQLGIVEVEGLGDLIQAETEAQRQQALRLFSGTLTEKADKWRKSVIRCSALLEVTLDFSDEELPAGTLQAARREIAVARAELQAEAAGVKAAERIREGFEVAIVGAPNTGKSTLLNRLAGREAAITSERAGTTRDVIEVRMDLCGLPVTLLDLAGIREAADPIEKIGVERARLRAENADLRVFLVDGGGGPHTGPAFREGDLALRTKADLLALPPANGISGKTGLGVRDMTDAIVRELEKRTAIAKTAAHARQGTAIAAAAAHLQRAEEELDGAGRTELAAEEVRQAARELESLLGRVDIEQVLGEIFAAFCLGK